MKLYVCPLRCTQCICSTAVTKGREDMGHFPGATARLTTKMSESVVPPSSEARPIYYVMDNKGDIIDPDQDPQVSCGRGQLCHPLLNEVGLHYSSH